jgi:hypothetical protein
LFFKGWRLPASLKVVGRNRRAAPIRNRKEKEKRAAKGSRGTGRTVAKEEVKSEMLAGAKEARESVLNFLRSSALEAARGVVNAARKGQVAQAKLLFEMTGIHPASEEAVVNPPQELLIQTLLRKVNTAAESGTERRSEAQPLLTDQPRGEDTVE